MAGDSRYVIEATEPVGRYAVGVKWGDGHDSIFPFTSLRKACPCDECAAPGSAESQPSSRATEVTGVLQVADASVLFRWADGHETLYLLEELRDLCGCAACKGEPDYPITGQ